MKRAHGTDTTCEVSSTQDDAQPGPWQSSETEKMVAVFNKDRSKVRIQVVKLETVSTVCKQLVQLRARIQGVVNNHQKTLNYLNKCNAQERNTYVHNLEKLADYLKALNKEVARKYGHLMRNWYP